MSASFIPAIEALRLREKAALESYVVLLQANMGGNPDPESVKKQREALAELEAAREALYAALRAVAAAAGWPLARL